MAASRDSSPDLRRIRKELARPRRERLRIIIASDPTFAPDHVCSLDAVASLP